MRTSTRTHARKVHCHALHAPTSDGLTDKSASHSLTSLRMQPSRGRPCICACVYLTDRVVPCSSTCARCAIVPVTHVLGVYLHRVTLAHYSLQQQSGTGAALMRRKCRSDGNLSSVIAIPSEALKTAVPPPDSALHYSLRVLCAPTAESVRQAILAAALWLCA
jgi:hypothetical protein